MTEATRLFAQRGFEGTTSAALAKRCGVSEALLYKLFCNKKQLYGAMIEFKLTHWEPLKVDPETDAPLVEVLGDLARTTFERVEADPDFARLMRYAELQETEFKRTFHEARGKHLIAELEAFFVRRIATGELRRDLDTQLCASSFLCLCWNYACGAKVFQNDFFPQHPDEDVVSFLVTLFARGLAA
ncbi:MAG: TetR/AcrR family transcriptional regulator [Planctomycetota bacterium]